MLHITGGPTAQSFIPIKPAQHPHNFSDDHLYFNQDIHPLYKYPTLYETKYPIIPVNGEVYIPGGYASNAPEIEIHHDHPFIHTEEDSDLFSTHHPSVHHYAPAARPPHSQNTPPRPIFGLGYGSGYGYGQPVLYGQPMSLHPYDYVGSDSTISAQSPTTQEKPWPNYKAQKPLPSNSPSLIYIKSNDTSRNQSSITGNNSGFSRPTLTTEGIHNIKPATDLMNFNENSNIYPIKHHNNATANTQFGYNGDRQITTYFNPDDYLSGLNNKRKSIRK